MLIKYLFLQHSNKKTMAIIEKKYQVDIFNVGNFNLLTNHGILDLLESIACFHSDIVGYGINQIEKTHLTWVLLHWKVHVFKRIGYGKTINVKTWASYVGKFSTLRDFEICDENGELICIASSKWSLIDISKKSITRITPEVILPYEPEEKSVFEQKDIPKIKVPELSTLCTYSFKVRRKDIDVNKHMHNICYLDYACEALPDEIYNLGECNDFEIMYKSGAKLGNMVNCHYVHEENSHFVIMKNEDNTHLHAVAKFNY